MSRCLRPAGIRCWFRMAGAGVNRGELIGGRVLRTDNPKARPLPSGIEIAGTIEALGADVGGWSVGDRVMARGTGCHAELAVVAAAALMPSPADATDVEAAAIPNVFVTAHDAVITAAAVTNDDRVLITAGSSGVGTAAIQIAKHLGATVIATTRSPSKAAALRELGADQIVDTTAPDWATSLVNELGPMTCVIDQVGGELFPDLVRSLGVLGRYVSVGRNAGPTASIDLDLLARNRLTLIGVTFRTRSPAEALECSRRFADDLLPLFDTGQLRPVVDRTFPLHDLPARPRAHAQRHPIRKDPPRAMTTLDLTPLTGHVGASVGGLSLAAVTDDEFDAIRRAFLQHCVLVFPRQHLSVDDHVAFAARWGSFSTSPFVQYLPDHPQVLPLRNLGKAKAVTENWHYDSTFLPLAAVDHRSVSPRDPGRWRHHVVESVPRLRDALGRHEAARRRTAGRVRRHPPRQTPRRGHGDPHEPAPGRPHPSGDREKGALRGASG